MRFRRKSALDALDEAAKLRHDLRLRWLDEAERAANHENEHPHVDTPAFTATPEAPSEYDPDYRSRRPYIASDVVDWEFDYYRDLLLVGYLAAALSGDGALDLPPLAFDRQPTRKDSDGQR